MIEFFVHQKYVDLLLSVVNENYIYVRKYVQYRCNDMDVICTACEHKGSTAFSELMQGMSLRLNSLLIASSKEGS